MKIIFIVMTVLSFSIFAGSGKSKQETQSLSTQFETSKNSILVNVKGMVCDFCAQGLKKKFGEIKEVEKIDVDLESGNVLVQLKAGKSLTDAVITKAVEENGLEVIAIKKK